MLYQREGAHERGFSSSHYRLLFFVCIGKDMYFLELKISKADLKFKASTNICDAQEVEETFVCAPIKRPERQWPLPKDRHCPQTFLFGQRGIRRCCLAAPS